MVLSLFNRLVRLRSCAARLNDAPDRGKSFDSGGGRRLHLEPLEDRRLLSAGVPQDIPEPEFRSDTRNPTVLDVSVNDTLLTDADVGTARLAVTVDFSEAMDVAHDPTVTLLPSVAGSLTLNAGESGWVDSDTYVAKYDVTDADVDVPFVCVVVSGAADADGNLQQDSQPTFEFSIDTFNPLVQYANVNDTLLTGANTGTAKFVVTFAFHEPMDTDTVPSLTFAPAVDDTLTLNPGESGWSNDYTFVARYDVEDADVEVTNVRIDVAGARDAGGNLQQDYAPAVEFDVDTLEGMDYGDAPVRYPTLAVHNGARHAVGSLWLGPNTDYPDCEVNGRPSSKADGDDNEYDSNYDDENGVAIPPLYLGLSDAITVMVSGGGYVDAWIDFNRDGDWTDAGEKIHGDFLAAGVHEIPVDIPVDAQPGVTYARFRISSAGGLSPQGFAPDGEVEDYAVDIEPTGTISGNKWNDLDGDGNWDAGEPGLAGWRIYVDANLNHQWDPGEPYDDTDGDGAYSISGLRGGTYVLAEVFQEGWDQTYPATAGTGAIDVVSFPTPDTEELIGLAGFPLPAAGSSLPAAGSSLPAVGPTGQGEIDTSWIDGPGRSALNRLDLSTADSDKASHAVLSGTGGFHIYIEEGLLSSIQASIDTYVSDLLAEGYAPVTFGEFSGNAAALRSDLQGKYGSGNLEGALFVGDIPYVEFESEDNYGGDSQKVTYPHDLYFMDLDGTYVLNPPGTLDEHTAGAGDVGPEIYISRITTGNLDGVLAGNSETELINDYFAKVHAYRTGLLNYRNGGIVFADDEWDDRGVDEMDGLYPDVLAINTDPLTTRANYLDTLGSNYESILECIHSNPARHAVAVGSSYEWIDNTEVQAANPRQAFYNMFNCSGGRFSSDNNLIGTYVYGGDYGLNAVGSTKTGSMLFFDDFYEPQGAGCSLGESFQSWFDLYAVSTSNWELEWRIDWFNGMTMQGDPTLRPAVMGDIPGTHSVSLPPGGNETDVHFGNHRTFVSGVLRVDADSTAGAPDGLSWYSAYADLQDALLQAAAFNSDGDGANDVDQIWIAEGTYRPRAELEPGDPRSAVFSLVDGVTLSGGFAGTETSLEDRDFSTYVTTLSGDLGVPGDDSDNAYTVVYCGEGVGAAIDGLSITAGNADGGHVSDHPERGDGGAIYSSGTLAVANTAIFGNAGYGSGGVWSDGVLTVVNTTFRENKALDHGSGGAISNSGELTMYNSALLGNAAESRGGGICNFGTATVVNTVLSGNAADTGGGICSYNTLTIAGGTLSGNAAESDGGGVYNLGVLTLHNSIVAKNTALSGPDVYQSDTASALTGYHNLIGDGAGQTLVHGTGANLVGDSATPFEPGFVRNPSDGGDGWRDDPDTPGVDESADNDYGDLRLRADSPAVDGGGTALLAADSLDLDGDGNTTEPVPFDLAGNPRIEDGDADATATVDVGAYEFNPSAIPGDLNGDGTVNSSDLDVIRANWGRIVLPGALSEGDPSGDGLVNSSDLDVIRTTWGTTTPPAAIAEAPSAKNGVEPATTIASRSLSTPITPHVATADAVFDNWNPAEAAWANASEALQADAPTKVKFPKRRALIDLVFEGMVE